MDQNKALRLKIYKGNDENVQRVVDIDIESNLEELHLTILAAFELNAGEMASFWLCENGFNRTQEVPMLRIEDEESKEESACMSDVKTYAAINNTCKSLIYEYDMLLMWEFKIEYIEQVNKIASMSYPVLVEEMGKVENPDEARAKLLAENTTESIANDLLREGGGFEDYDESIDSEYEDY
ncbi:MAG: hypothetical protein JXQ87_08015 [Bacteroidia bacterium]